ncbi:MAG: NUDIX domain-containing protein [Paludibacter sp.]|nr:NUDIX domain-containing protein [Paludibacter sp.]
MKKETFPLVDETGKVIGKASRKKCHSGSFLLHPVVHLHVINSAGKLFLQKRVPTKDIQPDKWDTSVGGHVDFGEEIIDALTREAREELGIREFTPVFMLRYKFTSEIEAELVHSYYAIYDGDINMDPAEISEGKFWSFEEINDLLNKNIFTPNFEQEFRHLIKNNLLPVQ